MLNQKTKNKYLDAKSIFRYFMSIKEVYIKGVINDNGDILDEDIFSIIPQEQDGIDYNAFRALRTALNHYISFLKSKGHNVKNICWQKFLKYVERSCKLIMLPSAEETEKEIQVALNSGNTAYEAKAFKVIMAQYMGLRISEIEDAEIMHLGKDDNGQDEDYIEVIGKFGKPRRVPLGLLGPKYKQLLELYGKKQTGGDNIRFFKENEIGKKRIIYKSSFNKIAPNGMHSYRAKFATDKIIKKEEILDISSILGHESARVTHNSYDLSAFFIMKDKFDTKITDRDKITQKELSAFLQMSKMGVVKLKNQNKLIFHKMAETVSTKYGGSRYYVDYSELIEKLKQGAIERTSGIKIEQRGKVIWVRVLQKGKPRYRTPKKIE
jgi:site-specific recombinase XerC